MRQSHDGVVQTLEKTRHGLEDGDHVVLSEMKGLQGFDTAIPVPIKVEGTHSRSEVLYFMTDLSNRALHVLHRKDQRCWAVCRRWQLHTSQDAQNSQIRKLRLLLRARVHFH